MNMPQPKTLSDCLIEAVANLKPGDEFRLTEWAALLRRDRGALTYHLERPPLSKLVRKSGSRSGWWVRRPAPAGNREDR